MKIAAGSEPEEDGGEPRRRGQLKGARRDEPLEKRPSAGGVCLKRVGVGTSTRTAMS